MQGRRLKSAIRISCSRRREFDIIVTIHRSLRELRRNSANLIVELLVKHRGPHVSFRTQLPSTAHKGPTVGSGFRLLNGSRLHTFTSNTDCVSEMP